MRNSAVEVWRQAGKQAAADWARHRLLRGSTY
jgi:hypothetical protein